MIWLLLIVNIIWIFYSMLEGLREGFFWFFRVFSRKRCDFEIHPIFMIQRGIVISIISAFLFNYFGIQSLLYMLSFMLVFSFFHNGAYYLTRHKLDNASYLLGWKDQSTTSTAKLTKIMTYRNRTILMAIGYILQVIAYLYL